MIIQCKQCATKFRFNDELMTGDGVWVRCGRCGHEFFEINTRKETFVPPARPEPADTRGTGDALSPPGCARRAATGSGAETLRTDRRARPPG